MSADTGIYVLKTKDNEYRVIYDSAIDNLYWDPITHHGSDDLVPIQVVKYFGESKVTKNANIAMNIACDMKKKVQRERTLEYGICVIDIDLTWKEITKFAHIGCLPYHPKPQHEHHENCCGHSHK